MLQKVDIYFFAETGADEAFGAGWVALGVDRLRLLLHEVSGWSNHLVLTWIWR